MDLLSPAVNGKRYSCQKLKKIYSTINTNNKRYGNKTIRIPKEIRSLTRSSTRHIHYRTAVSTDSPSTFLERSSTPE